MKSRLWMLCLLCLASLPVSNGCVKPNASTSRATDSPKPSSASGHVHEGDDALVWRNADIGHHGYVISLGHHAKHLYAAHKAEPAVMITKNGEPVSEAKVFVTLLDAGGKEVIVPEQPTVYEPTTADEPAHYAQAEVDLPGDATELTLRYRIEFPEAGEFTQDVVVQTSKH